MLTIIVIGSSVPRSRTYERWRQRTTSPRNQGRRQDEPREEGHEAKDTNTKLNDDTCPRKERERVVASARDEEPKLGGWNDRPSEQKPQQKRSPTTQDVPRYSPMPVPVVEEPCTPSSEGQLNAPKIPSASGSVGRPKASTGSAPLSPISQLRSPLSSPRSAVSSLDKGE